MNLADGPIVRPERPAPTDLSHVNALVEEPPEPAGAAGVHQRQLEGALSEVCRLEPALCSAGWRPGSPAVSR